MRVMCLLGATMLIGLAGCTSQNPRVATHLNDSATLSGDLPANPMQWKVITSAVSHENSHQDSTMFTVFGNDAAVQYARTHAQQNYPTGSVISLVTWAQQEDPRWFGGNIPSAPRSVEFVTVKAGADQHPLYSYESYEGSPLKKMSAQEGPTPEGRTAYLLSQRAAVMP